MTMRQGIRPGVLLVASILSVIAAAYAGPAPAPPKDPAELFQTSDRCFA
jgi:hypothetical protein